MIKTLDEKFLTVIDKNTFYFFDNQFEQNYEGYINAIKQTLLIDNVPQSKRTMGFVIPDKINSLIMIECSFL